MVQVSAFGTKRTRLTFQRMSDFGGKADIAKSSEIVRLWPKADVVGLWDAVDACGVGRLPSAQR